jgi:hypothetical protein
VLVAVKAKSCRWPRRRPALTAPARGGCEILRSGRKNASRRGSNQRIAEAEHQESGRFRISFPHDPIGSGKGNGRAVSGRTAKSGAPAIDAAFSRFGHIQSEGLIAGERPMTDSRNVGSERVLMTLRGRADHSKLS